MKAKFTANARRYRKQVILLLFSLVSPAGGSVAQQHKDTPYSRVDIRKGKASVTK